MEDKRIIIIPAHWSFDGLFPKYIPKRIIKITTKRRIKKYDY